MLENVILQGDCLELMKDIPNGSIDMILADLPYGTTACSWDTIIPFDKLWEQYERVIKDNGAIVLTASQPFTSALVMSNVKMFRYEWIWEKNFSGGFVLAKKQPMKYHENVLVFYKKLPTYNPIFEEYSESTKVRFSKNGKVNSKKLQEENYYNEIQSIKRIDDEINIDRGTYPKSIQKINGVPNCNGSRLHPTQKPVELFEYLIKTYTNENEIVLDNTAGSCTTAIACLNTNRKYICMEKEEKYVNVGLQRVSEWKQKENTSKNIKKLF